ncbi:sensor histidine kinase [Cohnella caldifontis]|uniref:sensor histidine kinase n=1 Tax=Cohnella caldifontis TaxID=3027471 RepID=UPI0023EE11E2|nr:histidine kinase [Cohnella sp. YIM B05605]
MLPHITKRFNDMKLRDKMMLSYVLFFLLPFLIIGFFVVREYRQSALDKAMEQTENSMERVKARTFDLLGVAEALSNRLSLDSDLESVVTTRYQDAGQVVDAYKSYKTFQMYLDFNEEITRIKLYADNPSLLNNWEFIPLDEPTKSGFWYQSAIAQAGRIGWYYFPSESRGAGSMLSLVRSVYFQGSRTFGVLDIDLNTTLLNKTLLQEDSETLLADANNVIVASNRPNMIGKRIGDTHLGEELAMLEPGTYERSIDGQRSKVLIGELAPAQSFTNLKIVSVFSIRSITKEANRISERGLQIILFVTAAALLLIYLICAVLTKRLLLFNRQINKVAMGNFNAALIVDGNDELGQISRQFNQMVANVKELMEEVNRSHEQTSELERKQNEIKLKMLASQINPHFLYNALESIRMKAHLKGEKEIAQIVKLLGKLMRKNLEIKGREISLEEEIEIVRCYLEIQKFRHDDRLEYELEIDPGAERARILPLLVQPLVENAVIHGLESHAEGGAVRVKAMLREDGLEVSVADNGAGMPPERLAQIRESVGHQDADRIGLHNIQQRLRMTYGESAGLRIESWPGKGTVVTFRIPLEGMQDV